MKRVLSFALIVLMSVAMLAGCSTATSGDDTSWADVQAKGYFILGLDDSFPPMGYRDENNDIVGFDIDLARECAQRMGVEVQLQPLVWDYISEELNGKKVDVIWNGCTITDERKEKFDFTKPYMNNEQVIVVLAGSDVQTLSDLAGLKVGIQGGSSANIALDSHTDVKASLGEVVEFSDNTKALMDLENKQLDAVALDVVVFGEYNSIKPGTFRRLDEELGIEQFGIGVRKADQSFKAELEKALEACMKDGTTQKLADKWLGEGAGALVE